MLVVGAKGFAKEVLEILHQKGETENLCFYDDVSENAPDFLYGKFRVIKDLHSAQAYFEKERRPRYFSPRKYFRRAGRHYP